MANNQFMEPGCTITNKKYPPFSCTKPLYPNNPWMCVYTVKTIARFAEAQTMLLCIQDFLQKKKKNSESCREMCSKSSAHRRD